MSDTPRTDSVCTYGDDGEWAVAYKALCEILERENAELLEALKGARTVLKLADRSRAWKCERVLGKVDAAISKAEGK